MAQRRLRVLVAQRNLNQVLGCAALASYFPALAFLVIILAVAMDTLLGWSKTAFAFAFALIVATFLFFAPYTYGLPLSEHGIALRAWLPSWDFIGQK